MSKESKVLSEVAVFLAGVLAAGLVSGRRRKQEGAPDASSVEDLRRAVAELEKRLAGQETATAARLGQLETRIAETPSTQQIVGAMEQLLSKTMASLDDRLSTQAHSIEVLKTTVSQTDSLLERVLESLDSLQSYADPAEDSPLMHREAV
jgi:uncharacterized coiled-coil protein SlyX